MNILMVISQFSPIIGGAERQAEILAQKLVEKGIRVTVLTGWWNRRSFKREVIHGVRVFRNFSTYGLISPKQNRTLRLLGVVTYMMSLGFHLLFHSREFDLIHVHQVLYPAFISILVGKKIMKKPVVAKVSCSGLTGDIVNLKRFPLGSFQLGYIVKGLDSLISVNREGIEEFRALGYPSDRIQNIPNGVGIPLRHNFRDGAGVVVLTMVRLEKQKGIDVLLEAWSKAIGLEKDLKLSIVGQGSIEKVLRDLTEALKIKDSVEFTGEVRNGEYYLRQSDIFVLPSLAEGMSNALLEAMSFGLACVATKISGNAELLDESMETRIAKGGFEMTSRGILVNPEDTEGLSKAIVYLARHRELRETLGRNARKHIEENYSIDLIAEKYINLYHHILEGKRPCVESAGS
jgi:glycosyltransferase involved in cell wall biosynthesis